MDVLNQSDLSQLPVSDPEVLCSLYIPLGENAIIQLVDDFQKREDTKVLTTDLYYHVEIECACHGYRFEFYSRGLVTVSSKFEKCKISELIHESKTLIQAIPSHLKQLITDYHLSLIEVLGEIKTLPIHTTIIISDFESVQMDRKEFLKKLASSPQVNEFIGIPRSINSRPYEDVLIGTKGSILRSEDIEIFRSYHAYNRALHLFFTTYNRLTEHVWRELNECDELVNEFDAYLKLDDQSLSKVSNELLSTERRLKLSKTRFHVIHEIKNMDHFLTLTSFVENSIEFTIDKFNGLVNTQQIRENSFHIRKVLKTLEDRAQHLKIVSKGFISRARTLVTRLELYDAEITHDIQQRAEKIAFLENSWRRTYSFGLAPVEIQVAATEIYLQSPSIIYSLFIPLGENGIIRLVDRLKARKNLEIIGTDLYYHLNIRDGDLEISFYSRGLITVKADFKDIKLAQLFRESATLLTTIPTVLERLLTRYHRSLTEVLGNIEAVPIHKTIILGNFSYHKGNSIIDLTNMDEREEYLRGLSEDPTVLEFIGEPRSIDSREYEDVIIGTRGSLIRSKDIEVLLSYHAYNRCLHLFLEKYNRTIEESWNALQKSEDLVNKFEHSMSGKLEKSDLAVPGKEGGFSSNPQKNLRMTRLYVIQSIKNLDNFVVITQFIEKSIDFTKEKYSYVLESGDVKPNSFHIRKVLRTLQDRTKHLKILSENLSSQGATLISILELYDSEIAYASQQRIEKLAFLIGLIGIILAVFSILVEVLLS